MCASYTHTRIPCGVGQHNRDTPPHSATKHQMSIAPSICVHIQPFVGIDAKSLMPRRAASSRAANGIWCAATNHAMDSMTVESLPCRASLRVHIIQLPQNDDRNNPWQTERIVCGEVAVKHRAAESFSCLFAARGVPECATLIMFSCRRCEVNARSGISARPLKGRRGMDLRWVFVDCGCDVGKEVDIRGCTVVCVRWLFDLCYIHEAQTLRMMRSSGGGVW